MPNPTPALRDVSLSDFVLSIFLVFLCFSLFLCVLPFCHIHYAPAHSHPHPPNISKNSCLTNILTSGNEIQILHLYRTASPERVSENVRFLDRKKLFLCLCLRSVLYTVAKWTKLQTNNKQVIPRYFLASPDNFILSIIHSMMIFHSLSASQ